MSIDSSIPLSVKSPEFASPLEMYSAVEQIKGQREAAELRRLAADEAREKRERQVAIDHAKQAALKFDEKTGRISFDKQKLLAGLPGDLAYQAQQELDADEININKLASSVLEVEGKRRDYRGSIARTIRAAKYDPTIFRTLMRGAHGFGAIEPDVLDRYEALEDPTQIQAVVDDYISQTGEDTDKPERGVVVGQRIVHPVTGQVIYEGPAADDTKHSASYVEWQDHVKAGGKLTFDQFRVQDANLRRPVTHVNTGGQGGLPPRVETTVRGLATAFRNEAAVKRTTTMAEAVNFVQGLSSTTKNPADDQGLIYAFAKAMDPESVVREGEYATVQKYATSWLERFGFDAMRVLSSNTPILTQQARDNLKATIRSRFTASRGQYDNLFKSYTSQINNATGNQDGADRLTDYAGAFPLTEGATGGAAAGGPARVRPPAGGGTRSAPSSNPFAPKK